MGMDVRLNDGSGKKYSVKVTSRNQLVTSPLDFSTFYPVEVDAINTAFVIAPAIVNFQFIITDIILYANKSVGVNDATVEIYEAAEATTATVFKSVFNQEIVKQTSLALNGLNIIVTAGKWLSVKTNDATIFANVAGYYVPEG